MLNPGYVTKLCISTVTTQFEGVIFWGKPYVRLCDKINLQVATN